MAKLSKTATYIIGIFGMTVLVGGISGGLVAGNTISAVNKDKAFLAIGLNDCFMLRKAKPELLAKAVPTLEKKYGKYQGLKLIDTIPDFGDVMSGGAEYGFQVCLNFEKGPITLITRVSNHGIEPQMMKLDWTEGHLPRKKVRHLFTKMLR